MGLLKSSGMKKQLYLSFACMWAIMIFFAFFRGQQLATVMTRYNMAMDTLNIQQQYIGRIVTSLNTLHFNDLITGAFGNYPELHRRISPMLLDRDSQIEALYQALYNYRDAVLTGGILTAEEAEIHINILDQMLYILYYHYIPAGNTMTAALEAGDSDKFAEALFINFMHGYYLTGLAWEIRDRTFVFVDYVKDTMLYYDQIEDMIFNVATIIGISLAILLAMILSHYIQKQQNLYDAQLKQAYDEAKAVSESKTSFIANTSHEIRTPMNSIIGYSELAMDDDISETTREYLNKVTTNAKWLLNIINDVMDFSKIEAGKVELESTEFDISTTIEDGRTAVVHEAIKKGLELNISLDTPAKKLLIGDSVKLTQICINLLSNAIKFTQLGSVSCAVTTVEKNENSCTLKFEFSDTGMGMTAQQIEKIFDPFVQANVSTTRKYGGTGLGLAICTSYIRAMGGNLEVESTLGEGSKFFFQLTFDMVENIEAKVENVKAIEKPEFNNEEILVVEDNEMNQGVICEHLKRVGLRTVVAENGKIAVDMARERHEGNKPFALIYMDVHMPVMDGIETAAIIKTLGVSTPIIATTATLLNESDEALEGYGMDGYISKPFTTMDLYKILLNFLKPKDLEAVSEPDGLSVTSLKQLFFKQNQYTCDKIFAAIEAGKLDTAHLLAHSLKSNAGLIGEPELQKTSGILEECLLSGAPSEELLIQFKVEFDVVLQKIVPLLENEESALLDAGQSDVSRLFNELEILLSSGNTDSINYIDRLKTISGTETLITHIENFDMRDALSALLDLKKRLF